MRPISTDQLQEASALLNEVLVELFGSEWPQTDDALELHVRRKLDRPSRHDLAALLLAEHLLCAREEAKR